MSISTYVATAQDFHGNQVQANAVSCVAELTADRYFLGNCGVDCRDTLVVNPRINRVWRSIRVESKYATYEPMASGLVA
jgi:hypothetical protein